MAQGQGNAECAFFQVYAIFDLASGTVLDRRHVATGCRLDAAWIGEFARRTPKHFR
jgi:hypothetical protein